MTARYTSLPSDNSSSTLDTYAEDDSPVLSEKASKPTSSNNKLLQFLVISSFLSLCVSAFNSILLYKRGASTDSAKPISLRDLERPSAYIGLERIERPKSWNASEPIENFAFIVGQVQRTDPSKVLELAAPHTLTWQGRVHPDDRHFLISPTINTVAQFRVLDFGMESCQVAITLPPKSELGSFGTKKSIFLQTKVVKVDVFRLSTPNSADLIMTHKLSWNTRPPRIGLLGTLDVRVGETVTTPAFNCTSGSLETVEFACAEEEPSCHIDFVQDRKKPRMAAMIVQHSSL
ncbi:hypothetical protein BD410DRAFT_780511 [Rickenella mellea]|uniref:Ubiquitin 3 binding protein But2 C-terminal domain-containing protein n=1 Tax=Rickenella mellea TaxID=50990 RepID=A0A4R5XH79_9AGAM|nr:hypothetical protein BD410DRAFT_780511 [Rickenella mellea]